MHYICNTKGMMGYKPFGDFTAVRAVANECVYQTIAFGGNHKPLGFILLNSSSNLFHVSTRTKLLHTKKHSIGSDRYPPRNTAMRADSKPICYPVLD